MTQLAKGVAKVVQEFELSDDQVRANVQEFISQMSRCTYVSDIAKFVRGWPRKRWLYDESDSNIRHGGPQGH
jgi:hypothetical protein